MIRCKSEKDRQLHGEKEMDNKQPMIYKTLHRKLSTCIKKQEPHKTTRANADDPEWNTQPAQLFFLQIRS